MCALPWKAFTRPEVKRFFEYRMNASGPEPDGFGPEVSTTQSMKSHPKTICSVFGTVLFYLASFSLNAQYLENFTGQNVSWLPSNWMSAVSQDTITILWTVKEKP